MRWFQNLNTHKKLLLTFAILILTTAFFSSWTIIAAGQLRQLVYANQQQTDYLEEAAIAETNFQGLVVMTHNYWLTQSPFYEGQVARYQQQLDDYLRNALVEAQTADEREDVETLKNLLATHSTNLDEIGNQIISATSQQMEEPAGPVDVPPPGTAPEGNTLPADHPAAAPPDAALPDQPALQVDLQAGGTQGFVTEEVIQQADRVSAQVFTHLQNMTAKRGLNISALNRQIATLSFRLVVVSLISFFFLSILVIFSARVAKQVAEPISHLTNAIVSFEHNTFQAKQLAAYTKSQNELGQLARAFTGMASSIIDSLRLKDQFIAAAARFVPTQYLDLLEKDSIIDIELGDHVSAEMAVMFSDVRGFTTFSERMTPQQNFDFVNAYLEMVSPIIQRNDGFIVKFLGDGMMAIFPYGTESAVLAGIEKQKAIQKFNAEMVDLGFPPIEIGIGIHTGHMMVGMVGEELRMQGDAFSDTVNLTSRIEGLNKYFGTSMIISAEILMRLPDPIPYQMRYLGKVEVKGRVHPIDLYEVFDGEIQDVIALKTAIKDDFERGIRSYQAGHFAKAKEYFEAVLKTDPHDRAAELYLMRANQWLGKEPPADWEGVEVMQDK